MKLIRKSDEFELWLDNNFWIHIIDGEGVIRVSMDLKTWVNLIK